MTLLVIQQVDFEGLGIFEDILKEKHISWDMKLAADLTSQDIYHKKYKALIILGGPMGVYEVDKYPFINLEISLIQEFIKAKKSILGICFGAQLICKAIGGMVKPFSQKELGWYPIKLSSHASQSSFFDEFKDQEYVFHWHGDQCLLPEDATHIASSEICKNQAFIFQENVIGLQFHIEVSEDIIDNWFNQPVNKDFIQQMSNYMPQSKVIKDTKVYLFRMQELGNNLFRKFLQSFQL